MSGASVLFVHGAHFSGWCWLPVIERLAQRGVHASAVELPFVSFADDVDYLRTVVRQHKQNGKLTLVSTSYSGITAAAGGHEADHLMFVAARMPQVDESQSALSSTWGNPEFRACMQPDEQGVMHLTSGAQGFLFHRSPQSLASMAMERRRPMRSGIPVEPIADPAWIGKPSSYVVCSDDRAVRVDRQRERAALTTWSTEIDCDHSPFFSAPGELTDFIVATHTQACL